jgi:hypothetical protein
MSIDIDNRWNIAFTSIIRQTDLAAWGNWTLNPAVTPGAVGFIEAETGSFTPAATIPHARIINLAAPEEWAVESSSVHKFETDIQFKGKYLDPSSGTEVTAGLDIGWTFAQEGSIVSNGTNTGVAMVDEFGLLMADQYPWLLHEARSVDMATDAGITQGFGMITQVRLCTGGINLGSLDAQSTFSITGSVDGVNAMTGGGTASAGVKGSYKETNESKAFERRLWPAEANTAAATEIGISYQFASFDGSLLMPTWIGHLNGFAVVFDNAHGGTYIANCSVSFDTPGSTKPTTLTTSASGGYTRTIDGIPLDATNLKITVDFEAGGTFHFKWALPIATWITGQRTIDLSGVWPWGSHAKVRETNQAL